MDGYRAARGRYPQITVSPHAGWAHIESGEFICYLFLLIYVLSTIGALQSEIISNLNLSNSLLSTTQDSFKTYPPLEEVFLQLRGEDAYAYQGNNGAVTSVQFSPFHRFVLCCFYFILCMLISLLLSMYFGSKKYSSSEFIVSF